jgi:hypothetical protein
VLSRVGATLDADLTWQINLLDVHQVELQLIIALLNLSVTITLHNYE